MTKLYPVPAEFAARTRIGRDDYRRLYDESVRDPDSFWARMALRLLLHHAQRGAHALGEQRRRGRGEDVAARLLQQPLDQGLVSRHEGARRARALAERGHVQHAPAGMRAGGRVRAADGGERAAPLRAAHPEAVGVIEQEQGVVPLRQRDEAGQVGDVAVHAEDRIRDDQLAPRAAHGELGLDRDAECVEH